MSKVNNTFSAPEFPLVDQKDSHLEGIGANVKLLLKLIEDHNEANKKDDDSRKPCRVAGMIGILDDVKTRIEKSQGPKNKAVFRRCNTDLRSNVPKEKKPQEPTLKKPQEPLEEENEKLRKQLNSSMAARKSLERMFSSLGKEKEIMAAELARKVHELNEMEEELNYHKAQNEKLLAKVQAYAAHHKDKTAAVGGDFELNDHRNRLLTEKLLKSLEGYRMLKWKLREFKEENTEIRMNMEEIAQDVEAGLDRIHDLRHRIVGSGMKWVDVENELSSLECMFRCFEEKVKIGMPERGDCMDLKPNMVVEKSPILA